MPRSGCSPIWFGRQLRSVRRCDDRYIQLDRCDAGQPFGPLPFLPEEGEREVDALDLTEPCLEFGPSAAGLQIVLDFVEAATFSGLLRAWGNANTLNRNDLEKGSPLGGAAGVTHGN